ncbi:MAG: proprotein convertase P-domain-containing protein, partial [Thermogutta sp.]|uniref:proprotein convertase P-domain-containing protein n=1 Tax=Thermogutta sp. TaxID=1962930 RepID=UPI0019B18396
LVANAGGSGDNFTDTVFDDSAKRSILESAAPFTGTFRPVDPLSVLKDDLADGTWSLEVTDTMPWDTGTLNEWSLTFSYEEPYTVTDSDGVYSFSGLAAGDYTVRCATATSAWPVSADPGITVSLGPAEQRTGADLAIAEIPSTAVDLGQITQKTIFVDNSRPQLYKFAASHDGLLSFVVPGSVAPSSARVSLYNAQGQTIASHALSAQSHQLDWNVQAGGEYYLLLDGFEGEIRLINLVEVHPGNVTIYGTSGDDRIDVSFEQGLALSVNGVQYDLTNELASSGGTFNISANGLEGNDNVTLILNDNDWYLRGEPGEVRASSGSVTVSASGVEFVDVRAGRGNNTAELSDSPGDDLFVCAPGFAQLRGPGFEINVENFSVVHAYSRAGGSDVAHLSDSKGDDRFVARPEYSVLTGPGFYHRVKGFRYVHAYSRNGGSDVAQLYGSTGSDIVAGTSDWTSIRGDGYFARAKFFKTVQVAGNGGADVAQLNGSSQQDRLDAGPRWLSLSMNEKVVTVRGIPQIIVNGGTGWDIADLTDSPGDDRLRCWPGKTLFGGPGFNLILTSFEEVTAHSVNGGADAAELWDSSGDDTFVSSPQVSRMEGPGFRHTVEGFRYVHGYAIAGGQDTAYLSGGPTATTWTLRNRQAIAMGEDTYRRAKAFDAVFVEGGTLSQDQARLFDSPGNDYLKVTGDELMFFTSGWNVTLRNIPYVKAYGSTGTNLISRTLADVALILFGSWI